MDNETVELMQDADDTEFWLSVSEESLKSIWDNDGDDVYAELLG